MPEKRHLLESNSVGTGCTGASGGGGGGGRGAVECALTPSRTGLLHDLGDGEARS